MHENTLAALRRAAEEKHHLRLEKERFLLAAGRKDVGKISRRDLFMLGLALYWGEGYKGLSDELGFTNSDPAMILFFIHWLSKIYKIKPGQLILRVSINASHTHRVRQVERYWSRLTGIPLSQFTMTSLIKTAHKKIYANQDIHYGTLRVKVRSGTDLRRRILGSIQQLKAL
jgi:hypothetical protein